MISAEVEVMYPEDLQCSHTSLCVTIDFFHVKLTECEGSHKPEQSVVLILWRCKTPWLAGSGTQWYVLFWGCER